LRAQQSIVAVKVPFAVAVLALALASCATGPSLNPIPPRGVTLPQSATAAPSGPTVTAAAPSEAAAAQPSPEMGNAAQVVQVDALASANEPITAAELAAEPMPVVLPPEPPPQRATGGDPDSVTNATLQLRSEYGDLWTRIRQGFLLDDIDGPLVKNAEDWYAARPEYVARMIERSRR
jgi:membrane-bound lytic murein transglycosylase D